VKFRKSTSIRTESQQYVDKLVRIYLLISTVDLRSIKTNDSGRQPIRVIAQLSRSNSKCLGFVQVRVSLQLPHAAFPHQRVA